MNTARRLLAALAGSTPAFAPVSKTFAPDGNTGFGVRHLLAALAGSTPAFTSGAAPEGRTVARRLLSALAGTSTMFTRTAADEYHSRATDPGPSTDPTGHSCESETIAPGPLGEASAKPSSHQDEGRTERAAEPQTSTLIAELMKTIPGTPEHDTLRRATVESFMPKAERYARARIAPREYTAEIDQVVRQAIAQAMDHYVPGETRFDTLALAYIARDLNRHFRETRTMRQDDSPETDRGVYSGRIERKSSARIRDSEERSREKLYAALADSTPGTRDYQELAFMINTILTPQATDIARHYLGPHVPARAVLGVIVNRALQRAIERYAAHQDGQLLDIVAEEIEAEGRRFIERDRDDTWLAEISNQERERDADRNR
ncbi:hypothetical protein [Nocardia arthritidis]|uniref:Uncharacterized protein n=1 Tax=Nocardia arthritidis TaxID=228602 RepID=A0A6G9YB54_9NOCA|nr:hypothetical protein [Nocardia arthritidis]QIS10360.1 hypothetical protein F5544_12345 [Nocardia arthritidis]